MKKTGAGALRGVARQLAADRFFDLLTRPSVVARELLDGLAGVEAFGNTQRRDACSRQDRPTESDAWIDHHDAWTLVENERRRRDSADGQRASAEGIEPNRKPVLVAVDAAKQRPQDLRHRKLSGSRHVQQPEPLDKEADSVRLKLLLG